MVIFTEEMENEYELVKELNDLKASSIIFLTTTVPRPGISSQ